MELLGIKGLTTYSYGYKQKFVGTVVPINSNKRI
jgi:hypothetical protein